MVHYRYDCFNKLEVVFVRVLLVRAFLLWGFIFRLRIFGSSDMAGCQTESEAKGRRKRRRPRKQMRMLHQTRKKKMMTLMKRRKLMMLRRSKKKRRRALLPKKCSTSASSNSLVSASWTHRRPGIPSTVLDSSATPDSTP